MARKGATSTQRMAPPKTNGLATTDGDANVPPPSTIAAQIVQNAAHLHARQDASAKVPFGDLVKEFLQHPNTDEPDSQLVALVCVIAEAGLDGLFNNDPFAQDQQRQQGIDSISALKIIIEKKPHLLLSARDADDEGTPQPPLLVWLFPKLLGLMTHITLQPLHQHARELLSSCLEVLARAPSLWRCAANVALLYRSSVQLVVNELESVSDPATLSSQPFQIHVPSSSSIGVFWPESQQFIALPHDLQRTITSQLGAIYIGLNILLALINGTRQRPDQWTGSAAYDQHEPWFIDTCLQLWQDFKRWTTGADKRPFHDEAVSLLLCVLEALVLSPAASASLPTISSKTAHSLVRCLLSLVVKPYLSVANQGQLALLFIRLRSVCGRLTAPTSTLERRRTDCVALISDELEGGIIVLCQDEEKFSALHKDLQSALCLWTTPGAWPLPIADIRKGLSTDGFESFTDPQLLEQATSVLKSFRELNLGEEENRPAKRRKVLPDSGDDVNESAYEHFKSILVGSDVSSPVPNLSDLHNLVQARYSSMSDDVSQSEKAQCELLSAFTRIACAGTSSLKPARADSQQIKHSVCTVCDGKGPVNHETKFPWNEVGNKEDWKDAIAAMLEITKEPKFQEATKARVYMAVAIGRVFKHISDSEYLNLETCGLGQWLVRSISRSLRELRLAATRSLMVFLSNDVAKSVREKNRKNTLEVLDVIAKRDNLSDHETLITAYGLIARECGEVELSISLHHLIEYFGHPNALICALASNELDMIASEFSTNVSQLLQPYWRVLAFSVFRDVNTRPQKAQILADLTEQSVRQLLVLTQADTLPHLVLAKRRDVIEKIANARRATVGEVLTQPKRNLAKILALLLCQSGPDVEANAMDSLAIIEPAIREGCNNKLDALLMADTTGVAVEILLLSSDQEESKKKLFHRGFATLAMLIEPKPGQRKATSKSKSLDVFFEKHILGIVAHFTDIIESPLAQVKAITHPLQERKRSIAALGELVLLARHNVNGALPQFRACLQSAMGDSDLSDDSFAVWTALLDTLVVEEEVMSVIDQTFALIAHHWSLFSEETQLKAYKTISGLTQKYHDSLSKRAQYLPSLRGIAMMMKTEEDIAMSKIMAGSDVMFAGFIARCKDQNAVIVRPALKELVPYLDENQKYLHQPNVCQKPLPVLGELTRALLDASIRFAENHQDITTLCAQCLGIVGGLDPYRVEIVREKKRVLMLSNFSRRDEDIEFVFLLLEQVLVKVFLSTTNAKAQGWIAYVMQEMLKHCGFSTPIGANPRSSQTSSEAQRWNEIPEPTRTVLTPFRSSRYSVNLNTGIQYVPPRYPILASSTSHGSWLQTFVYDLLQKGQGVNVEMVFPVLARVIRGYDLSIATFILPFAALNVIVSDDDENMDNVGRELLTVLQTEIRSPSRHNASFIKQCSENVFQTLDYLSMWLQEKRKAMANARVTAGKPGRGLSDDDEMAFVKQISRVERILQSIPAEVISQRAVECGSYARALFHWEQYMRQQRLVKADNKQSFSEKDEMLQHLQTIYAQIDEPDCIEGISAHLSVLNPEQQIIEDRKAGRLNAAQSWYEIALAERPNDTETQINLLTCLKESGQYDSILNYVDGFRASSHLSSSILPFAAEAAWSAGKWEQLERILGSSTISKENALLDFNVGVGHALLALRRRNEADFKNTVASLRDTLAAQLSPSTTASIQACHDQLVKLHALYEMEAVSGMDPSLLSNRGVIIENLDRRLSIIGAYTSDKQYLLGLRRATMSLSRIEFTNHDIAAAWLTTGQLARKGDFMTTAFNSVMHAEQLGDNASKIEYSKLLWKEGHHRKAIQNLRGAIESKAFEKEASIAVNVSVTTTGEGSGKNNRSKCRAQLLLAKWLDRSGQTKAAALLEEYQAGVKSFSRWDKGHYYLGRYYLKLLESEKRQPVSKQSPEYLTGDLLKLVTENFIRSTVYGTKRYYEILPKILTLWLDTGMEVMNTAGRTPREKEFHNHKVENLKRISLHIKRYTVTRMAPYVWYSAFPQIITRISHPNDTVWETLQTMITHVATQYPQQTLWSLLAVQNSKQDDRRTRGAAVLHKLRESQKRKVEITSNSVDLRNLCMQGQRLTDALLAACDAHVEQRVTRVSLSKDLGFSHKLAPSLLVVPIEAHLLLNLPESNNSNFLRNYNPFPQEPVTISAFMDDVLVLSSLQRPRKLDVRGSDGRMYGLLCKPKDDLRKDQRLMEFNAMINRALQKDIECSKRRLYIKTYAVTPLNEECGVIEWVEGLKPMRDILIHSYRQHNIGMDYAELRLQLSEASSSPSKVSIFTDVVLGKYKPVLHEWFVETFPEPEAWFAARLRYTRSCAVMSIVGHVLGLGDRHGENILLEEGNGGTFHVDFNCLFDKGLTFEKPELVPFRLTTNMIDAMGPQGVEGPFRKAAELTYSQLRQHEETLITIMETFVHDPTTDFLGGKRKKKINGVPDTPQEVLDMVHTKVGGYLKGESVPLSVEGYVEALIAMARDPWNLASMYIGWCAFL